MTMRSVYQEDPTPYEDMDKPYPLSDYPSDRLLLESDDVVVETISDPDLPLDVRESMERHGEQTCLTVPLRYGATPLGMLTLVETAAERVVLGGRSRVRARVRRAGRHGDAQRPPLRGRQEDAPRQPARAQLGAHGQGHLHHRAHGSGGGLRGDARGGAGLDAAADPAARGGHVPARHRQDRRGRPCVAQVGLPDGRGVGADAAAPHHQRGDHRGPPGRGVRGRRAPSPRALRRHRLPRRPRRRGHPLRRPAPVPGRFLRRHVVAPGLPAGAHPRGVRAGAAQLQRDAVRPGAGRRVRPRARRPERPATGAAGRGGRSGRARRRRRPRGPAPPRGRGASRVRARPAWPARDPASSTPRPRSCSHRRPSTSCAA